MLKLREIPLAMINTNTIIAVVGINVCIKLYIFQQIAAL